MRKHTRSLFGESLEGGELTQASRAFVSLHEDEYLVPGNGIGKVHITRSWIGIAGVCAVFTLLFFRLGELQVLEGEALFSVAEENRLQEEVTIPSRGRLFDRYGAVLAENTATYSLTFYTSMLPKVITEEKRRALDEDAFRQEVAQTVVMCGLSSADMLDRAREAFSLREESFLLAQNIPSSCAFRLLTEQILPSGATVEVQEVRSYVTSAIPTLSHVLGYVGRLSQEEYERLRLSGYRSFDGVGKQGVERLFESRLHGKNGSTLYEVDYRGSILRTLYENAPQDGEDIVLSLDSQLQDATEEILDHRLEGRASPHASVVVMNPHTGEVLALVSYPSFDANAFVGGISQEAYQKLVEDPHAPLFNRSIAGSYPAGSTIKPLYAAGGLTDGIITPQTTFLSTGGLWLGNRFFPDWRAGGHGVTDVYHAIADSVNTFFYALGGGTENFQGMGVDRLMFWARTFGLGEYTGIGLSGESKGFLPSPSWKEEAKGEPWYVGDTYNVSIGQGDVLVSPLQIARATAVFANGGDLVTPVLEKDAQGDRQHILQQDIVDEVRQGMRDTVTKGTARMMQEIPFAVAGKTGTAQWSSTKTPHSWFTGFGPYEDPQIVITVLVEEGGDLTLASFVAHDVLLAYARLQAGYAQGPHRESP